MMRALGIWSFLLCPIAALAQSNVPAQIGIRPQAIIQVSKSKVGADLVLITVLDADYPGKLLQSQAAAMGSDQPDGIRGLQIYQSQLKKDDPQSSFWKASFAVNGLIDPSQGALRLQPIVRAMAGAPAPHTIHQFFVEFDRTKAEAPTLADFSSPAVQVKRQVQGPTVEYAVTLLSQIPSQIQIPDTTAMKFAPVAAPRVSPSGPDWVLWATFLVGAVAAGALVYSLLLIMLRSGNRNGPRR